MSDATDVRSPANDPDSDDRISAQESLQPYRPSALLDDDGSLDDATDTVSLTPPVGLFFGASCGVIAAVLYTGANIALRFSVGVDPFLVSAVKSVPTVVFLAPFLLWMKSTKRPLVTSSRWMPRFMLAALLGQFFGNAGFQIALQYVGLAVAVPICLGVLIIGGAVLARVILGEPVGKAKTLAIAVLIAAVTVLSVPAGDSGAGNLSAITPTEFLWGALCAAGSGAAYSFFGVTMRQALTGGMSAPATMFISGAVGFASLWSFCWIRIGLEPMSQVSAGHWLTMFAAGALNFSAFVALSTSLKALPVVAVNLINASQVAMAALAGVVLFAEPVTQTLAIGIALTFAGLGILASARKKSAIQNSPLSGETAPSSDIRE